MYSSLPPSRKNQWYGKKLLKVSSLKNNLGYSGWVLSCFKVLNILEPSALFILLCSSIKARMALTIQLCSLVCPPKDTLVTYVPCPQEHARCDFSCRILLRSPWMPWGSCKLKCPCSSWVLVNVASALAGKGTSQMVLGGLSPQLPSHEQVSFHF